MDLGGLGAVRGDRPRRPPSTLETESVLEPGRTEVGGAEPGTSSHRPGRGRPPGSPALRGSSGRTEAGRAGERAGLGWERAHTLQPACRCPPGPALLQHGHALLTAGVASRLRGGNRSQAVAEVPRVPSPLAHLPGPGVSGPGPRASAPSSPAPSAAAPPSPRCAKGWPAPGCAHPHPALP